MTLNDIRRRESHVRSFFKCTTEGFDEQVREGLKALRASTIGNRVFQNETIYRRIVSDDDYATFVYDMTVEFLLLFILNSCECDSGNKLLNCCLGRRVRGAYRAHR